MLFLIEKGMKFVLERFKVSRFCDSQSLIIIRLLSAVDLISAQFEPWMIKSVSSA